jgi:hypothetical protein
MKHASMLAATALILLGSCAKEHTPEQSRPAQVNGRPQTTIAATTLTMENSHITLPKGTTVTRSADGLELEFSLPEGYSFLTDQPIEQNVEVGTAARTLPVGIATYKCHCSSTAGSNCMVFYQDDAGGFGCMHKSCSGTCTGGFTANGRTVLGVLDQSNSDLDVRVNNLSTHVTLDSLGWNTFFNDPAVQRKISQTYTQLYRHTGIPDFDALESNVELLKKYVHQKVRLYGVIFYLLVPASDAALRTENTYEPAGATCSCTGVAGTCIKKSKGFFGYRIYWCQGSCNSCALSVD